MDMRVDADVPLAPERQDQHQVCGLAAHSGTATALPSCLAPPAKLLEQKLAGRLHMLRLGVKKADRFDEPFDLDARTIAPLSRVSAHR